MKDHKEIKIKVMELMGLCYEVNANTKHDVYFNFHSHVDNINIHIDEGGFNNGGNCVSVLDTWGCVDNVLDDINEAIEILKGYLNEQ